MDSTNNVARCYVFSEVECIFWCWPRHHQKCATVLRTSRIFIGGVLKTSFARWRRMAFNLWTGTGLAFKAKNACSILLVSKCIRRLNLYRTSIYSLPPASHFRRGWFLAWYVHGVLAISHGVSCSRVRDGSPRAGIQDLIPIAKCKMYLGILWFVNTCNLCTGMGLPSKVRQALSVSLILECVQRVSRHRTST
jgi:hypothetical protein